MLRALACCLSLAAARALPSAPAGTAAAALTALSSLLGRDAAALVDVSLDVAAGGCATVSAGAAPGLPLRVSAASAVDAVAAVAEHLRRSLNASFSWPATGGVQLAGLAPAAPLPAPAAPFSQCRAVPWTYYQNVVQSSYSNVWWLAPRWETELAWMAAHGVNLALAYGGQEALFADVYTSLGLNESELGAFFNGPAYLSWSRGQGQAGVGGPLPTWWYQQQLALNQGVVEGMVALGITPILPVFQGNVPLALRALFPAANISSEGWLDVFDPLFTRIADAYMAKLLAAYPNKTHFYEADGLFSSGTPPWARRARVDGEARPPAGGWRAVAPDPAALARSRAAYASFARHDPDANWCYQAWIWRGMSSAADLAYALGWLGGPPPGRLLLLDQTAERVPIWAKFGNWSFTGQPYAWLSMNTMGGNVGLVGSLAAVSSGVAAAAAAGGELAAVGMDPEGINTMPAYWAWVLSMSWAGGAAADPAAFLADYGVRRCGREDARVRSAWALLAATVFRANQSNYEHHLVYCPSAMPLEAIGNSWNRPMIRPGFAAAPLAAAWSLLLQAAPACAPAARYDLVDVGREFMSLFPCVAAHDALDAAADAASLAAARAAMADTLGDLDDLLASQRGFLVGEWLAEARALGAAAGATPADQALLTWNARAQISTWFPTPPSPKNGLYDYANKVWAGVVRDYYLPRYELYADARAQAMAAGGPVNATAYEAALTALGEAWTRANTEYPAVPVGDALAISQRLYNKYAAAAVI